MPRPLSRRAALAAPLLALPALARADSPRHIGVITSLTGPHAVAGQEVLAGFKLAMADNRLGGVPVVLEIQDDAGDERRGRAIATRFIEREGLRLYTGIVSSSVFAASVGTLLDEGGIYVSPSVAPPDRAGAGCNPNYYVMSWQNDCLGEAAAAYADRLGYHSVATLADTDSLSSDVVRGFRRLFKGLATPAPLDPAGLAAAPPDALFLSGSPAFARRFLQSWQASPLRGRVALLFSAVALDPPTLAALGPAALGIRVAAQWNADFDNVANHRFVQDFTAAHHRPPGRAASQGYDTALAIGAALFDTHGALQDTEAFRQAIFPAAFESVRGKFRFDSNQNPIQDWWGLRVEPGPNGTPTLITKMRVLKDHSDAYAAQCQF